MKYTISKQKTADKNFNEFSTFSSSEYQLIEAKNINFNHNHN